ncbi:MAG: hypothetical protein KGL39_33725 [Patescibacteria group bacterium]|nr:hypothetical protein [Patescibacteria group bacterium]
MARFPVESIGLDPDQNADSTVPGEVTSVFGRFGVVAAQTGDYTAAQVTGALPTSGALTNGHLLEANSSGEAEDSGLSTVSVVSATTPPAAVGYKLVSLTATDNTARWVADSGGGGIAGYFSPETYGAIGDGVTDDSLALNACMNAVRAYGKGATMFLSKTYNHQGPLNATEAEGFAIIAAGGRKNIMDTGPGLLFGGGTGTGALSSLSAAITSTTATTLTAPAVPAYMGDGGFLVQIDSEYVWVYSGASTTTWTVRRGLRGSTPATHAAAAQILPAYGAIIAGTPQGFTLENVWVCYNNAAFNGDLVDFDWYPYTSDCTNWDVLGCAFTGVSGTAVSARSLLRINHAIIGRIQGCHFGLSTGPGILLGDGAYVVSCQVRDNTFNCGTVGAWAIETGAGVESLLIEGNAFEPIAGTYAGAWKHTGGVAWHVSFRNNWMGDQSSDSQAWVQVDQQVNSFQIAGNRFTSLANGDAMVNFTANAAGGYGEIACNYFDNGAINFTSGGNVAGVTVLGNYALHGIVGGVGTVLTDAAGVGLSVIPAGAHPSLAIGASAGAYTLDIDPVSGPNAGVAGNGARLIAGRLFFGGTAGNQDATASIGPANLIGLRVSPGASNALAMPTWSGYNFAGAMTNGDSAVFFSQDGTAMHPRFLAVNSTGTVTGPNYFGTYLEASGTWNPGAVANGATVTTTLAVANAQVGQPVSVGLSTITVGGIILAANVTAAGTVTVSLTNNSGASQTIGSGILLAQVWQH